MKPEHVEFHKNYMIRKQFRIELQKARCADKDHSVKRYQEDAKKLNLMLAAMGITDQPVARWGK
jgi:hypothetical protein